MLFEPGKPPLSITGEFLPFGHTQLSRDQFFYKKIKILQKKKFRKSLPMDTKSSLLATKHIFMD